MNMHATPQRTKAEDALIEAFHDRLADLPGDGAVMVKRDNAIEQLKLGLPTKRIEAWHYTDLRRLLSGVPSFDQAARAEALAPIIDGSAVLPVLNGVATGAAPVRSALAGRRGFRARRGADAGHLAVAFLLVLIFARRGIGIHDLLGDLGQLLIGRLLLLERLLEKLDDLVLAE